MIDLFERFIRQGYPFSCFYVVVCDRSNHVETSFFSLRPYKDKQGNFTFCSWDGEEMVVTPAMIEDGTVSSHVEFTTAPNSYGAMVKIQMHEIVSKLSSCAELYEMDEDK